MSNVFFIAARKFFYCEPIFFIMSQPLWRAIKINAKDFIKKKKDFSQTKKI
jgi:hypothetical protein